MGKGLDDDGDVLANLNV